ncbi:MAG: hypothetical protein ACRYF3_13320 [Janthinobacterium lividum]
MVLSLLTTAQALDVVADRLALLAPPAAGPLVVAVDGRSGSGKTDLATALSTRLTAPVVHMDDLYPGWDGLQAAVGLLTDLLCRLRSGDAVRQPVWDWSLARYTRDVALPRSGILLIEGVGAGCAGEVDLLVWMQADTEVRRERALARDGETFRPHWERWGQQEETVFRTRHVRTDADLEFATHRRAEHGPLWELCGGGD